MTVISLLLLALAGYSAYAAWAAERAYPPAGQFVDIYGGKLHYIDKAPPGGGEGAPIVLIHGASGNLRDFLVSIFGPLAERHRVIAVDRPGHGWSDRPDAERVYDPAVQAQIIHDALEKLGIDKPVVLGHSWGGAVAAAYALQFPDDLSGLLVLSGATHPWPGGIAWYHKVVRLPVVGELFLRTLIAPAGKFLSPAGVMGNFAPDAAPAGFAEEIGLPLLFRARNFRHNSEDTSNLKEILRIQSTRYEEIAVPTIVITGNRDQTVLAKIHSYALHEQVAGSELIKLQGTGHMPHHARPEPVLDALRRLAMGEAPRAGTFVLPPLDPETYK